VPAKKAAPKAAPKAAKTPDPAAQLKKQLAKKLGLTEKEVDLRALEALSNSLADDQAAEAKAAEPEPPKQHTGSYLPQRLYLLLDGRGLDGRGLPFEVIDLPCYVGSGRRNTVWINSPQIETKHLMITHTDEGWLLEDLNTEHGTFMGDKRIQRRVLRDGDDFRLAGYLRLRTELR
jgi:FHA domain